MASGLAPCLGDDHCVTRWLPGLAVGSAIATLTAVSAVAKLPIAMAGESRERVWLPQPHLTLIASETFRTR